MCLPCDNIFVFRVVATEEFQRILDYHLEAQRMERQKLMDRHEKVKSSPDKYVTVIVDGMDQSKTNLPHFRRLPEDSRIREADFLKVHVVGAKVEGHLQRAYAMMMFNNFSMDSNSMLTVLHKVTSDLPRPLPKVLFLTLDNTSRENKSKYVLAYLVYLVHMKVFEKIKLNFLLVGHTHDNIDQMFNCFSRALAHRDAYDLPALETVIRQSYTKYAGVHVERVFEVYDWKAYVKDHLAPLHDISFNQHFCIQRNADGSVAVWSRQFYTSSWHPQDDNDLDIFKALPDGTVHAAPHHVVRSMDGRIKASEEKIVSTKLYHCREYVKM
ncbi:hypothetical protein CBR_g19784 [Chara braunii]|uniref:DUF7869 domain-containing protein n=1 Tax=Chara braunii TaxID=69332 RepID=A0A388JU64_CHABU|nr:hypothetical protein CBR_g19784 [Chara braunii]|eukprot:GBG61252.1 hypothetical protein CBR_g19784 [Chara braunii]